MFYSDYNFLFIIVYLLGYFSLDLFLYDILGVVLSFLSSLLFLVMVLVCIAYFTLLERKILGGIQRRRGPNYYGFFGVLQPLADAIKLASKDVVLPLRVNIFLFLFTPVFTFFISLITWTVLPFGVNVGIVDIRYSILFIIAVSSLGAYGVIFSGWSSNSKYSYLGSIRAISQIISYELSFGCIFLLIVYLNNSTRLLDISINQSVVWLGSFLCIFYLLFFVTGLAETNRIPFDLPEAEAELVAGYNVEYSALFFALFFLAEYSNMLLFSMLATICFLGNWFPLAGLFYGPFSIAFKVVVQSFIIVWVRGVLPRFRYDQLLELSWKRLLPLLFGMLAFYITLDIYFVYSIIQFVIVIIFLVVFFKRQWQKWLINFIQRIWQRLRKFKLR